MRRVLVAAGAASTPRGTATSSHREYIEKALSTRQRAQNAWRIESSDNRTQAEGDELGESVAAAKRQRRRAKSISQNRHDGVEIPIRAPGLSASSFSSDGHELTDGPGDLFLRCRIEIGVHGQAEHLVREALRRSDSLPQPPGSRDRRSADAGAGGSRPPSECRPPRAAFSASRSPADRTAPRWTRRPGAGTASPPDRRAGHRSVPRRAAAP